MERYGVIDTISRFVSKSGVITELEIRKLLHDPTELLTRAVQPILWLLVFGEVFTQIKIIPTPGVRYIDFMTPGILGQSVLFISIFYGIAIIWERDLGIVQRFLTTPTPRTALVAGKAFSADAIAAWTVRNCWMIASALWSWGPQSQRCEPKTSPVRHSECTRTSTFSKPRTSPITKARCSLAS